ncbi:hypothetical protein AS189_04980 [Arthrobacter alpinus]|uniref:Uncharacterized protein n=1 Tax=Arthrobacter alpinus TaxID=656366 RepID=A0A0S2LWV4_9MICC|nr:hypothetical protein [Arthrobacter alpinus]ALO65965.1 hypothetical protein AS189_04980 [Arthrobacter alpinus]
MNINEQGAQRQLQDQQTKAWHEQAVASGQKRYLKRASNGELVSYLPEEYGVGRTGLGPKIYTVWGHGILVAGELVFLVLVFQAINVGYDNVPMVVWFTVAFFTLVIAYSTWNLVKEAKATRLRRQRGLPTPAE